MSNPNNGLVSLDDLSMDILHQNIKEYPYIGAYHLALAQKVSGDISGDISLFCNDRVQLHYTLHNKGRIPTIDDLDIDALNMESESKMSALKSQNNQTEEDISETVISESVMETAQIVEVQAEVIDEVIVQDNTEDIYEDLSISESIDKEVELSNAEEKSEAVLEDLKSNIAISIQKTKSKKQRKRDKKFKLNEYSGISDFSKWLLSFQKEDLDKKIRKEEKAAKRKAFEASAMKSVTKTPSIISEPLAEILANQGHLDDAKKMYEQLMVKYPEKSTYFAEKINHLIKV
ncbi:MAG: hypothetical protein WAU01_09220 [Saprospiraceae bacterium]